MTVHREQIVKRERENQQDATIRCLLSTFFSRCFGHHYAHLGRCVVGCSHPTTQRPTTANNHIQQNQRSTPHAVTHGLCSPEDGNNDARSMLWQKLIINIWVLHLLGFLSLHSPQNFFFVAFSIPKCYHIQLKYHTSYNNTAFYLYKLYICQGDMFRPSMSSSGPPRTQI